MSEDQAKVENSIVVSFDDVKMKDFRAYWQSVVKGDWNGQDAFFAKVVRQWKYDGNPAEIEACGELELSEYASVQAAIDKASTELSKTLRDVNIFKRIK